MTRRYTGQEILDILRSQGRYLTQAECRSIPDFPSVKAVTSCFGSWENAWYAAGYEFSNVRTRSVEWTQEKVISVLRDQGRYISQPEWESRSISPSRHTISKLFSSWNDAWLSAGIEVPKRKRGYSDSYLLDLLKRHGYMNSDDWDKVIKEPNHRTYVRRFGSWKNAWSLVGLKAPIKRYSDDQLLQFLKNVGRRVSMNKWDQIHGVPRSETIAKRFGTWLRAWDTAGISVSRPREIRAVVVQAKKLGGFQSGFHTQSVSRSDCKWPEFLICSHGCGRVIQLVSHVSGEVEFELCAIEAKKMGQVLLEAVRSKTDLID